MGTGNAAIMLAVDDLVLDPRLQCREQVDEAVVESYADLLQDGVVFPAIEVVRVDGGQHLVTDGWHRVLSHRRAKREEIAAVVHEGTRRDALARAVRANADHGLQRSQADKRRAVRLLLMDAEWCRLSGRELAELAGVSHTYVNQARKRYGVRVGVPLSEDRVAQLDGELPEVWRAIFETAAAWEHKEVEQLRTALSPRDLCGSVAIAGVIGTARAQRRRELATQPWPWDEETLEARQARGAGLDTVEDLERAVCAVDCPDRDGLYHVLEVALAVPRLDYWRLCGESLDKAVAGRPALEALLHERRQVVEAAREAARQADPYARARAILTLPPTEQAAAVRDAPAEVLLKVPIRDLHPQARDTAYQDRVRDQVEDAPCPDPACGGWVMRRTYGSVCAVCGQNPQSWIDSTRSALRRTAQVLERSAEYGVCVRGVVVDGPAVRVLAWLQEHHDDLAVQLLLDGELRELVDDWRLSQHRIMLEGSDDSDVDEEDEELDGVESAGDEDAGDEDVGDDDSDHGVVAMGA